MLVEHPNLIVEALLTLLSIFLQRVLVESRPVFIQYRLTLCFLTLTFRP